MKTLIFPDVHTRHIFVDEVVKREKPDRVVMLGDFFDQFHDTPSENRKTAKWLKQCGYEWCYGNHDVHYAFSNPRMPCSGYEMEKKEAINEVMTHKDWEKGKFFIQVDDWLCTHAGLHPYHIPMMVPGKSVIDWLWKQECIARARLNTQMEHWFWAAGMARGGSEHRGGILWCDFNMEFEPVPGLNQIFGHTPQAAPAVMAGPEGVNICLDTHLNHYVRIVDGIHDIIEMDKDRASRHFNALTNVWPGGYA